MAFKDKETVGNFEAHKQGLITRREALMLGAVAATSIATVGAVKAAEQKVVSAEPYTAKDFGALVTKNMPGLSSSQIEQHLKLYKGYVGKSNEIYNKLKDVDITSANATYSPLRELLLEQSFAVNGVVYHELYFGNLGGSGGEPTGDLKAALDERFGSGAKFMDFLKASGKSMRGWVIVGYNMRGNHIDFFGLDTHNMFSPTATVPLLVLDVYEHAYMIDYGIDRAKYLDAFVKNLDWSVVAKRFGVAQKKAYEG
ncbi:MAG: superoxide dismutase [Candidatus Obscuribacter sp.]|nr:superoxide dismutase [Candidatus Obscuribacter sp.]MBK9206224.1 superoxide dismutase [Candidatus Obscuribacter sp.]MBL0186956.1 superoxide dismutase [Candidatus Obscuribacter sp.]MBP6349842.1 superoxide dismutase [Candidatus Obscuribacter sp.]MBP7578205.1 superoxide dismutase [Candidatus Obscuribacter sp.]